MPLLVRMEKWIDYIANNIAAIDFSFLLLALPQMNTAKKDFQNKPSFVFNAHRIEMKFPLKKKTNQATTNQQHNHFTKKALSAYSNKYRYDVN